MTSSVGTSGGSGAGAHPAVASSPPGSRLGEVELADRLGVSRTPVREALTRLAAEGLVEIIPNRGARVSRWTVTELEGVFDLRAVVEPRLTALAVPHAGPGDVAALDALAAEMVAVGTPGPAQDLDALVPLNRAFHDRLVALADHPALARRARRGHPPADRAAQLPRLRRRVAAPQPRPPRRDRRRGAGRRRRRGRRPS